MRHPVILEKNEMKFPMNYFKQIVPPFNFILADGNVIPVEAKAKPVYFTRKRIHVRRGQIQAPVVHSFCVGDSNKKFWVSPEGRLQGENKE